MRLIDADALRKNMEFVCMGVMAGTENFNAPLCEIDNAPTIQPEPHWIPCSERLPENNDPVNVTYVNHNPGNYYAEVKDKPYTATAHFHKGQWYWYSCTTQDLLDEYGTWIPDLIDKDVEILAWMPLPEPYKGVTDGRD